MKTLTKIKRIKEKIKKLREEVEYIRNTCDHEGLTGQYHADTGNYDPHQDYYYIVYHCPKCEKVWTEHQSEIKYSQGKFRTREGFAFEKE